VKTGRGEQASGMSGDGTGSISFKSVAVCQGTSLQPTISIPLRVLSVVPYAEGNASMPFVRRQNAPICAAGVVTETFMLASRTAPLTVVREWRRLRGLVRSFRPDVVHAQFGTVTALVAVLSTSLPVVVTYRGSDLNGWCSRASWRSPLARLLSQIAALRARQIVCVSEEVKSRLWWRKTIATVIPTGVDTEAFCPQPRDDARRRLGWGLDEGTVIFNASRDPMTKRLDLAQASVKAAEKLCGKIRFVVLDGNVRPDLVPTIMNASDCLLLTSDREGSPTVIQEAMACCLPVVSVDVGDVRERLRGIEPTRIVSRDAKVLGQAVAEIITQRERANGRPNAERISTEKVARQLISVYQKASPFREEKIQACRDR
jgi:teichuronic acid biosynthesis glycosyltransferase TuaC